MTKLILITGLPGTGKTTIVKRLVSDLKKISVEVNGFYTEEVRDAGHQRIGFDIYDFAGAHEILARSSDANAKMVPNKHKVGKYNVYVDDFERIALPIFAEQHSELIIDEIGKMELLSEKFEKQIKQLVNDIKSDKRALIATVPSSQRARPPRLVEDLKAIRDVKVFEITKSNRNLIYDQILKDSKNILKLE